MERKLRDKLPGGRFVNVAPGRSRNMSAIRNRGNRTTETRLRFALVGAGISGWKLHASDLPGSPDFVFPQHALAVFVDGCFWHGCPLCGHYPLKRKAFWMAKIERNRERDLENTRLLKELDFSVLRFWEHELSEDLPACIGRIKIHL